MFVCYSEGVECNQATKKKHSTKAASRDLAQDFQLHHLRKTVSVHDQVTELNTFFFFSILVYVVFVVFPESNIAAVDN